MVRGFHSACLWDNGNSWRLVIQNCCAPPSTGIGNASQAMLNRFSHGWNSLDFEYSRCCHQPVREDELRAQFGLMFLKPQFHSARQHQKMKRVRYARQGELSQWRMLRIGLLSCGEPPKHRFDSV